MGIANASRIASASRCGSTGLAQRRGTKDGALLLGGRVKTGHFVDGQNRPFSTPVTETNEFYFVASSVRKSVWTLVRQLRGPRLSTWA